MPRTDEAHDLSSNPPSVQMCHPRAFLHIRQLTTDQDAQAINLGVNPRPWIYFRFSRGQNGWGCSYRRRQHALQANAVHTVHI